MPMVRPRWPWDDALMSDEGNERCPHCGELLEERVTRLRADEAKREGPVEYVLECVNPDCPSRETNLAPAAEGQ